MQLSLVKTKVGDRFTDVDFTNMRTFGDYAALTIDNLYNFTEAVQKAEDWNRELEIGANIQKNMLPERIPGDKRVYLGRAYSPRGLAETG